MKQLSNKYSYNEDTHTAEWGVNLLNFGEFVQTAVQVRILCGKKSKDGGRMVGKDGWEGWMEGWMALLWPCSLHVLLSEEQNFRSR